MIDLGTLPTSREHLRALERALGELRHELPRLERWGGEMAMLLRAGGRLLAAGNGGSAAEAQHLTAELVGRYRDERTPLSALALHTDSSALTAIANDYGTEEVFARQVRAHGRPGDVLLLLSTSGESPNVVAAAREGRRLGLRAWALTGPGPNSLSLACDDALCVAGPTCPTIQEVHLVAVHLLCTAVDRALAAAQEIAPAPLRRRR